MSDREASNTDVEEQGELVIESVQQAVDDWVITDEIQIYRDSGEIVAEEKELVQNISIMIAIAVDEAAE